MLAIAAAAVPIMTGIVWVADGAGDPVRRSSDQVIPAFAAAEATTGQRPRILALQETPSGAMSYDVLRGRPAEIGAGDVEPRSDDVRQLSTVVADLAAARGDVASAALSTYGIGYVLLRDPVNPRLRTWLSVGASCFVLIDIIVFIDRRTGGSSAATLRCGS